MLVLRFDALGGLLNISPPCLLKEILRQISFSFSYWSSSYSGSKNVSLMLVQGFSSSFLSDGTLTFLYSCNSLCDICCSLCKLLLWFSESWQQFISHTKTDSTSIKKVSSIWRYIHLPAIHKISKFFIYAADYT